MEPRNWRRFGQLRVLTWPAGLGDLNSSGGAESPLGNGGAAQAVPLGLGAGRFFRPLDRTRTRGVVRALP